MSESFLFAKAFSAALPLFKRINSLLLLMRLHNRIDRILIDKRKHSSMIDVWPYRATGFLTEHCLAVYFLKTTVRGIRQTNQMYFPQIVLNKWSLRSILGYETIEISVYLLTFAASVFRVEVAPPLLVPLGRWKLRSQLRQYLLCDDPEVFNPLKTKRRLLYLKTQFVPRSKHFSSRL